MYNLANCSIVIPVHIDSTERLEHVHFAYNYFIQNFINYQLIIVEQGKKPQICLPTTPHIQIEFINSEKEFSPSEISNIGASFVKNPFFCKYDADVFIHPRAIFEAFEMLKNQPHQSFILPYNRVSFSITNELRKKMLQSPDFNALPVVSREQAEIVKFQDMYLKCLCSCGLIHHFNTAVFKEFGGYDEEFIGWGYEDTEILARFKTLGHPAALLENYNAFHLEHPRGEGDPVQIFKNYCRKQVRGAMSAEELRSSIKQPSLHQNRRGP